MNHLDETAPPALTSKSLPLQTAPTPNHPQRFPGSATSEITSSPRETRVKKPDTAKPNSTQHHSFFLTSTMNTTSSSSPALLVSNVPPAYSESARELGNPGMDRPAARPSVASSGKRRFKPRAGKTWGERGGHELAGGSIFSFSFSFVSMDLFVLPRRLAIYT